MNEHGEWWYESTAPLIGTEHNPLYEKMIYWLYRTFPAISNIADIHMLNVRHGMTVYFVDTSTEEHLERFVITLHSSGLCEVDRHVEHEGLEINRGYHTRL